MKLEVKDLEAGYGESKVLRSISLEIGKSSRVGLFGPNGHGKTTLLRVISGLIDPWNGTLMVDGQDVTRAGTRTMVDLGIIHVPQGSSLFPRMTVEDNLYLGAHHRRNWGRRRTSLERVYSIFPRLAERRAQKCQTLSGGERQMLAMGIGLMGQPRLLMLDEPTLGLAPKIKDEVAARISDVLSDGIAILLVDQDVEFLSVLVDELYLLEGGEIRMKVDPNSHTEDAEILEMYFGKSVNS